MAVKTKEEILELVKTRIGDDSSEEALSFIEDITDTLTDREKQISESGEWKNKYDDLSKKYKERFFEGDKTPPSNQDDDDDEGQKKITRFEDLFTTKED